MSRWYKVTRRKLVSAAALTAALVVLVLLPLTISGEVSINGIPISLPDDKADFLEGSQAARATQVAAMPTAAKPASPNPPTPLPRTTPILIDEHHAAGDGTIVESNQAPFPGEYYIFQNYWFKDVGEGRVIVYAGAERANPRQGLVAVVTLGDPIKDDGTGNVYPAGFYRTPEQVGPLRIDSADGERLTLIASDGIRYDFQLESASLTGAVR